MGFLYDGCEFEDLVELPIKIFVENRYKDYEIPEISIEKMIKIIELNCFETS